MVIKSTCPRLIADTSRTAALSSGPAVAGIERTLKKASFLVKGSTPDARAAKKYLKYKKARALDPLGRVITLPFDGSEAVSHERRRTRTWVSRTRQLLPISRSFALPRRESHLDIFDRLGFRELFEGIF